MTKRKALNILKTLKTEISVKDPTVEDGYARRYKECFKMIFGEDSQFYNSANKINFLYAHPEFSNNLISQNSPMSACGIARDLLNQAISYVNDFGAYSRPKTNYFNNFSNWKILTIIGTIFILGFSTGWTFSSGVNFFNLINYNQQPKNNSSHQTNTKKGLIIQQKYNNTELINK